MFPAVRDWSEAMLTALAGGMAMFFAAIPKVIAFAIILIVGWFVAGLIARLAARLLRAVHFNDLAESSGFGNFVRNSLTGPAFWKVDLAVSRLFPVSGTQNVELRLEAFNVTNRFNWGTPNANLLSSTFGRILSINGDPRILQFGIKYGF